MTDKQPFRGDLFRPGQPGLRKILGDLEAAIMEEVWAQGDWVTVRQIADVLKVQRGSAYTTVMTVMGNLAEKGLLHVDKLPHSHRYRPTQSREAFTRTAVGYVIDQLLTDFADPALAHFAERLSGDGETDWATLLRRIQDERTGES